MTYKERLQQEHPECEGDEFVGNCFGCPGRYDYGHETWSNCTGLISCEEC